MGLGLTDLPGPGELRRHAAECTDPELALVLDHIARRRAQRNRMAPLDVSRRPASESPSSPPTTTEPTLAGPDAPVIAPSRGGRSFAARTLLSPDVRIIELPRPAGFEYRAGQHVKLSLPGVGKARSYSIASAPHDPHLEFCIEHVPGGRLTPKLFAAGANAGLVVSSAAKGKFVLDSSARTHLMVATVTGIAPLRSMLRDALHRDQRARFIVLHGASYTDELPYLDELRALADTDERVEYIPTISRPGQARNQGWTGRTGRVDDLALELAASLASDSTRVYACGNGGMVARVRQQLGNAGFTVYTESFGG